MSKVKQPEYAPAPSVLDPACVADGQPLSAHVLREMIRQSNAQVARSSCIYRWTGHGVAGVQYAPARWRYATPFTIVPVRKPAGVVSLSVRARLVVASGREVELAVLTSQVRRETELSVTVVGTGSVQTVDLVVPCSSATDEALEIVWRAHLDPTGDPVVTSAQWTGLTAATFGDATWGTPTLDVNETTSVPIVAHGGGRFGLARGGYVTDQYVHTQWITTAGARGWRVDDADASALQRNGFYTYFGGEAYQVGRAAGLRSSTGLSGVIHLLDTPPTALRGATYTMRQLPVAELLSVAVYG